MLLPEKSQLNPVHYFSGRCVQLLGHSTEGCDYNNVPEYEGGGKDKKRETDVGMDHCTAGSVRAQNAGSGSTDASAANGSAAGQKRKGQQSGVFRHGNVICLGRRRIGTDRCAGQTVTTKEGLGSGPLFLLRKDAKGMHYFRNSEVE